MLTSRWGCQLRLLVKTRCFLDVVDAGNRPCPDSSQPGAAAVAGEAGAAGQWVELWRSDRLGRNSRLGRDGGRGDDGRLAAAWEAGSSGSAAGSAGSCCWLAPVDSGMMSLDFRLSETKIMSIVLTVIMISIRTDCVDRADLQHTHTNTHTQKKKKRKYSVHNKTPEIKCFALV